MQFQLMLNQKYASKTGINLNAMRKENNFQKNKESKR